ncbi:AAA family ATPase [Streptomyces sp. NPDC004539]|uniref:helix-turn-helix transcriptional regulator n=1 Tax=Streptomyces sp. NPDC004539 TaxID=3154280 RepID=UPI00339FB1AF
MTAPGAAEWRGESGILLVRGAKCSGKTVLLGTIGDSAAESGALVLRATGWPSERAFAFGVLRQLLNRLAESGEAPPFRPAEPARNRESREPTGHDELFRHFLRVTARRPLLLVVDDVHHADPASQDFLRFAARHLRGTSVRLALAERTTGGGPPAGPRDLGTDVMWLPHTQVIRLGPLTRERLAEWIVESTPAHDPTGATARRIAARVHEVGGGNVLLSRILLERRFGTTDRGDAEDAGADFQDAVRGIVDDSGVPVLRRGARAAAVLGRHCSPRRLTRLLHGDSVAADRVLRMLEDLGMMHGAHLRGQIGAALLDDHGFVDRAGMHLEAAHVLFDDGLPPDAVAHHLTAAGRLGGPWHPPLVLRLVRRSLETGDTDVAETVLGLARTSLDPAECAAVEMLLLRATWLENPSLAASLVPSTVAAARRGVLRSADLAFLVRVTTVHGFPDEADELLCALRERTPEPGAHREMLLAETLYALWQGPAPHLRHLADLIGPGPSTEAAERLATYQQPSLRSALYKIPGLLETGDRPGAVLAAERILEGVRDEASGLEPFLAAWWALATVNALPLAGTSCAGISEAFEDSPSPLWRALLCLFRARCATAAGDLADAHGQLRAALGHKPWDTWGSLTGLLGAALVEVLTEMGRHEEAADVLALPLHPAALRGTSGLLYTRARGRHHLATGRLPAALSDFEACRDACALSGCELPMLLPWRCDIAETYLRTGDVQGARHLLGEQLALLPDGESGVRGTALRLLALTCEPADRVRGLDDAADQLERHGNHLQLAYTLADLAHTHQEAAQPRLARTAMKRAQRIAGSCEAGGLQRLITVDAPAESRPDWSKLSLAERRVALLAAQGHTNREISARLFVTPSTVEQHLTRIYRKLGISRREDLGIPHR